MAKRIYAVLPGEGEDNLRRTTREREDNLRSTTREREENPRRTTREREENLRRTTAVPSAACRVLTAIRLTVAFVSELTIHRQVRVDSRQSCTNIFR